MDSYLSLARHVLDTGKYRRDRTGTGTIGVFGAQLRHDLRTSFPLLTTKRVHTKSVVVELLWMLNGDTSVATLADQGVTIWNEWTRPDGTIGPGYGWQWRHFGATFPDPTGGVDQLADLIAGIKKDPFGRRHIITAWNPVDLPQMALPPCHAFVQFYVSTDEAGEPSGLSCHLYQRSADLLLGVPFNIASYALLTHIIARECGLEADEFIHSFGDLHIYTNHVEQIREQLSRQPRPLPTLVLAQREKNRPDDPLPSYRVEDVTFVGYDPHPAIKAPVAV